MANPTYRRILKLRPTFSTPQLPFGGGLIVNEAGGMLLIDLASNFLLTES